MFRVVQASSAAKRIAAAVEFIHSFAPATELVIVGPFREAVDDLVRGLAYTSGATFGLHRFSFTQLAARLAIKKLAAAGVAPSSAVGAEALAVRATYEAVKRGKLPYFAPVTKFPGFARATAATVAALRAAGIAPERLEELEESGADHAALLECFQEQIKEVSVADRTILFQAAIEEIRAGVSLCQHPLLFVDVPIHSPIERGFLIELAVAAKEVLFTCPAADVRTLDNLNMVTGAKENAVTPAIGDSSLARLGFYLFSEKIPPEGKPDDEVVFFSAPGEERESVEIARRILSEAEKGVPFERMTVLLRAPETYGSLMEAALRRAGIPAYFARGNRRPDPSGRALLALLACASEGLSAHRFAEYLSFAQVPSLAGDGTPSDSKVGFVPPQDDALGSGVPDFVPPILNPSQEEDREQLKDEDKPELAGALRAPWKWEELLVDAAVIGGKDRWTRRLGGLQNQFKQELQEYMKEESDSPRVEAVLRKLRNLQHLTAFVLPVIGELAALPESTTWAEWIVVLERLVPRVLRQPERVLAVLADLKPMGPVASVPLAEVQNVLQQWLANLQQRPPESRYGCVLVASPEQARGRSFDLVFIPGLAERMFPQKLREDPLLLDKLRRQLSSDLSVLSDRSQQERLLLQIAVGAASRRLYLSYPRLEVAEGRARVPSFYALDVARSITGRVPDYEVLARESELAGASRLAWPAPRDPSGAIDDAEYDLATVWPLLNTTEPRAGRLAYVMKLNSNLARSLRGRWARWQGKWSEHDGLFTKRPLILKILESQRLASRPYSVSALQNFAACPYRFLLSSIFQLEPREEPAPLEEMDPLTKGGLFHRVQAVLQRDLKDKGLLPVKAPQLPEALKMLDGILKRVAEESYEELAPAIDRVWLDDIEAIRSDLRVWLQKVTGQDGWVPIHFEFGFGLGVTDGRDPASLPDPAKLAGGAMVRGVVDLIERSDDGNALRITDHKTGKDRTKKGLVLGQGEYLQPLIYGLSVEAALKRTVAEGRFFYCTSDGGFTERSVPLNPLTRQSAEVVLHTIDGGIAAPFLVAAPREDACSCCDFQEVCGPYEEIRFARKKETPQLVQLKIMRDLA
ncbi:MAG: PD-(D/E)XK nuclease family protein [Silvibacterium sp.]